jgi:hypothetical protein
MSDFTDHRAQRLWAAEGYDGNDRPPYPYRHALSGVPIGRVLIRPLHWRGKKVVGLVSPLDRLMEIEFKAREKRQNRKHFP